MEEMRWLMIAGGDEKGGERLQLTWEGKRLWIDGGVRRLRIDRVAEED